MKTIEEVIKNKALIISSFDDQFEEAIEIHEYSPIIFSTCTEFKRDNVFSNVFNNITVLYKILKPFIYYSFSFTIKELPERCTPLLVNIRFTSHHFNDYSDTYHHINFFNYDYEYVSDEENIIELNKKILMRYEEEICNKNCFCRFADPFSPFCGNKNFC